MISTVLTMAWVFGLLPIIGVAIWWLCTGLNWDDADVARGGKIRKKSKAPIRKAIMFGLPVVAALFVLSASVGQVEAGNRGVVLQMGKVTGTVRGEGMYFKLPWIQSVTQLSVQTVAYEAEAESASNDLQDVFTTVTLNYKLQPDKVATIYQTLRKDYEQRIIKPAIQESVKAVTANFNAEELVTKRPEVKQKIESSLTDRLVAHGITIDTLSITNFKFSETFTASIEAKVSAAQKALEAENKLRQVQVEAQQVKAKAEGDAQAAIAMANGNKLANITNAEGQAQAIKIVADQQAAANNVINASITEQLIRYNLVNKLSPSINTIVLPAGQDFILGESILGK
jgi:regulator of protease activity HflC (stomatin/prohibitin superfamily)